MRRLPADGRSLNSDRIWGTVIPVPRLHRLAFPFVYFVYFMVPIGLLRLSGSRPRGEGFDGFSRAALSVVGVGKFMARWPGGGLLRTIRIPQEQTEQTGDDDPDDDRPFQNLPPPAPVAAAHAGQEIITMFFFAFIDGHNVPAAQSACRCLRRAQGSDLARRAKTRRPLRGVEQGSPQRP